MGSISKQWSPPKPLFTGVTALTTVTLQCIALFFENYETMTILMVIINFKMVWLFIFSLAFVFHAFSLKMIFKRYLFVWAETMLIHKYIPLLLLFFLGENMVIINHHSSLNLVNIKLVLGSQRRFYYITIIHICYSEQKNMDTANVYWIQKEQGMCIGLKSILYPSSRYPFDR